MWIISTILEGGDLEEAIMKAIAMNAKRPSHLPPQGFLLSMLARIGQAQPEVHGVVDVPVVDSSQTS
ncbi:hypothetical protein N836_26605 [Leptolyngbya sp. Heron Island J]|uniref:hypothetical protein n=1 Tax=Leptolyngbya sp. Heron Island J TaxID=1385935 RepID=UPI0003B97EF4|nr:hypothetical protein [Leptolyngbya sp. Heron Island J]ESA32165.1 hypothetical protein N836_26605 [Leptolyngbya sp. Heron Island J]